MKKFISYFNGYKMPSIFILCIVFLPFVMISCKKKMDCLYDRMDDKGNCLYDGIRVASFTYNGVIFNTDIIPEAFHDNHYGEYLSVYIYSFIPHPESERWEQNLGISFRFLPFEEGKVMGIEHFDLEFPENHSFSLFHINIDAILASYDLNADRDDSYIELEEIDRINKTVKGKYHVHFKKRFVDNPNFPDEIEVEGTFESSYRIRWE